MYGRFMLIGDRLTRGKPLDPILNPLPYGTTRPGLHWTDRGAHDRGTGTSRDVELFLRNGGFSG